MRSLFWARRALALALFCAGSFSVPFAVTWWLERDRSETRRAVLYVPSSGPTWPGLTYVPSKPLRAEPAPARRPAEQTAEPARPGPERPVLIDEIRDVLSRSFYRPISESALGKPSIGQIIDALGDPYTDYLTPLEFAKARAEAELTYEGVGLLVGQSDIGLTVTSALKGPAREAGIRPGDVILSIDGNPVGTLPFDGAISLFRGERGTIVTLMIQRPGEDEPRIARAGAVISWPFVCGC